MIDKDFIKSLINNYLQDQAAVFLVDLNIRPGNIIVVEIDSDDALSIDDCVSLSRYIESNLDREKEDFELEVGSAGITAPFKLPRQYQKNIGNEVEVLTKEGRKLIGVLKSCNDIDFTITIVKMEKSEGAKKKMPIEEDAIFDYKDVKYTKYLMRFK